jgi:hypothetical protein
VDEEAIREVYLHEDNGYNLAGIHDDGSDNNKDSRYSGYEEDALMENTMRQRFRRDIGVGVSSGFSLMTL